MRHWLGTARQAARLVADRPALWLSGALGWLAWLGWIPLVVTVVPLPDAGDLAYLGARVGSSGAVALLAVGLALAVAGAVVAACGLAALADVALLRATAPTTDFGFRHVLAVAGMLLFACLPAAVALAALGAGIAAVGPGEFLSGQPEATAVMRILGRLWPLLALVGLAVGAGRAWGAATIRSLVAGAPSLGAAIGNAARMARANLGRHLVTAAAGMAADGLALALSIAMLRVLWAPIAAELAAGQLLDPATLLLLVGFVMIWIALVLGAGALAAWHATWWSLQLGRPALTDD